MSKFYTGIGSRKTPKPILEKMTKIAIRLHDKGHILRSGGADGADSAFEKGANNKKEIYLPWDGFNDRYVDDEMFFLYDEAAEEIAAKFHPKWKTLKQGAKKLHTRNVHQVLGLDLKTPSELLICWTEGGETVGGTATAIKIANHYGIPVYNLGKSSDLGLWK